MGERLRLEHPLGDLFAMDGAQLLVLVPGQTRDVASDNHLQRHELQFADQKQAAFKLVAEGLDGLGKLQHHFVRPRHQVVGKLEEIEPELQQLSQDLALVGDAVGHDDIVGQDAIGGHKQEGVVVDLVEVTDLASGDEGEGTFQIGGGDQH